MKIDVEGGVRISLEIEADELRRWSSDRVSKLFEGLALVTAATGARVQQIEWGKAPAVVQRQSSIDICEHECSHPYCAAVRAHPIPTGTESPF